MNPSAIKARFDVEYNCEKNLMTPEIIRYGREGLWLYELSKVRGISDERMYGVTVLHVQSGRNGHDLNRSFSSERAAERHIDKLSRHVLSNA